ncbi:Fic family protein [Peptoniphilus sp. HMSC062D09]|uniref:Fic family protein n=1 Tax=Peptoniphilus TaxID=162289 RepID=UPI0008A5DC4C|nr:Fic family protein [Peptoniphilus sp. HMSC062D09]OFK84123.1 death-on-curing protein [Peptoniphilus sp. HMSC062D09]
MADLCYITLDEAIEIHKLTVQHSGGGALEHFDLGRLDSVLQNIQNDDYYPSFVDKITHLFFCACEFHCFEDGNKRIAITLSAQFLLKNGYLSVAQSFLKEMENISYHVAAGKIDKDLLYEIMESILKGSFESDESLKLKIIHAIM